jgi:hypothetical protein
MAYSLIISTISYKKMLLPKRGGPPTCGLGERLTNPYRKKNGFYEMLHRESELTGLCEYGNELSGSIKGGKFLG